MEVGLLQLLLYLCELVRYPITFFGHVLPGLLSALVTVIVSNELQARKCSTHDYQAPNMLFFWMFRTSRKAMTMMTDIVTSSLGLITKHRTLALTGHFERDNIFS